MLAQSGRELHASTSGIRGPEYGIGKLFCVDLEPRMMATAQLYSPGPEELPTAPTRGCSLESTDHLATGRRCLHTPLDNSVCSFTRYCRPCTASQIGDVVSSRGWSRLFKQTPASEELDGIRAICDDRESEDRLHEKVHHGTAPLQKIIHPNLVRKETIYCKTLPPNPSGIPKTPPFSTQ